MIIQIGTEEDESRILWKKNENDDWKRADIDDLIKAYEIIAIIVRCKNCTFFEKALPSLPKQGFCHSHESIVYENDFCSYGERKSDE